jgi:hypothetical protein
MSVAQLPSYEYVLFKKNDRKTTVQLPEFTVQLKKNYKEEKAVFKDAKKLFVLSDIEGEYQNFKQLLIAAGVMNNQFKWTFGKGHLVICGDMFDRGSEVTEVLWLIYHLEEQAKEEDGYVHFILGNHEVMNLTDDLRYLNKKYSKLATDAGIPYRNFYNKETELGQWLRTKNIIEKIGDLLFVHGGVSQHVNQLGQPVEAINMLARPFYDNTTDSLPPVVELLLSDAGPLWYRGYFMNPTATMAQVDSTLKLFRVNRIIIGHTPVKQISSFYNGKVINVDVPHAKGVSEGLLIDDKKYYRLGQKGEKTLLF